MHKRKRVGVKPSSSPQSDINITPLVDVVLVLLIIFMVVTPLLEKDIGVRVPTTEKVDEIKDVPPDQLVVKVSADGALAINQEKVPKDEYVDRLKGILAKKGPLDKVVFVTADEGANYGYLVQALDGAKLAGAETLGMATELIDKDKPPEPATP